MAEQKLDIIKNGEFKNLNLKNKYKVENGKKVVGLQGIDPNNHIIIEKVFADGLEKTGKYGSYYIVRAKYKDEEVSFILNQREHDEFREVGGIGDKVRISVIKDVFVNSKNGAETYFDKLQFSKEE